MEKAVKNVPTAKDLKAIEEKLEKNQNNKDKLLEKQFMNFTDKIDKLEDKILDSANQKASGDVEKELKNKVDQSELDKLLKSVVNKSELEEVENKLKKNDNNKDQLLEKQFSKFTDKMDDLEEKLEKIEEKAGKDKVKKTEIEKLFKDLEK